jgi:aryl-alcohol dehydrogenase-like predicted oxidoreductase
MSVRGSAASNILKGAACECSKRWTRLPRAGAPLGAGAIAWTLAQPGIVGALASATSVDQLEQSFAALTLELSRSNQAPRRCKRGSDTCLGRTFR